MQVGGESYTKRAVQIGDNDGEYVEIIDGLIGGERIVTKGAMLVKAASIVQGSASHEHNH
jgi:multidrug efflux pump subunit AcrA (membrane-fusion protein)